MLIKFSDALIETDLIAESFHPSIGCSNITAVASVKKLYSDLSIPDCRKVLLKLWQKKILDKRGYRWYLGAKQPPDPDKELRKKILAAMPYGPRFTTVSKIVQKTGLDKEEVMACMEWLYRKRYIRFSERLTRFGGKNRIYQAWFRILKA